MTPIFRSHEKLHKALAAGTLLCVAFVGGVLVVASAPTVRQMLLSLIALALVAPLLLRAGLGRFDLLEPVVWLNLACLAMFFVRPIALISTESFNFRGVYDVRHTFDEALFVALVGVTGLQVGYHVSTAKAWGNRLKPLSAGLHLSSSLALISLMLVAGGAAYFSLYGSGQRIEANASSAYIYYAPYMIAPACMLLSNLGKRYNGRWLSVIGYCLVGLYALSIVSTGRRLMLMQILLGFFVLAMLRRRYRPSAFIVIGLGIIAFYLIVGMRDLQPTDDLGDFAYSVVSHVTDTTGSIKTLTTDADTEMFDGLAAELSLVPETFEYQPGSAIYLLLTHPIPRLLWEDKPRSVEELLNYHLFGTEMGTAGVAYSVLGGFYFDSGLLGVFVGMAFIGLAFRLLWEYMLSNSSNDSVMMLYASSLPFVVSIIRGNLQFLLAIALFVVVPIVVVTWLSGERSNSHSST